MAKSLGSSGDYLTPFGNPSRSNVMVVILSSPRFSQNDVPTAASSPKLEPHAGFSQGFSIGLKFAADAFPLDVENLAVLAFVVKLLGKFRWTAFPVCSPIEKPEKHRDEYGLATLDVILKRSHDESSNVYLFMEHCTNGDVMKKVRTKKAARGGIRCPRCNQPAAVVYVRHREDGSTFRKHRCTASKCGQEFASVQRIVGTNYIDVTQISIDVTKIADSLKCALPSTPTREN